MSRETLSLAVFVSAVLLERVYPHSVLRVLAVSSAVLLMVSQGFILYRARAVAAWNVPVMPLLFLSSGLASGSGVLLMAAEGGEESLAAPASLGLLCAALNAAFWLVYLNGSRSADFLLSTEAMRRPLALVVTVGIGSVVPMLLLLMLFDIPGLRGGKPSGETIAALSGLALLAGTAAQKVWVVRKAGYLREIVLRR
jgi:formate-dependent nitrite reductase membrane component NrfD